MTPAEIAALLELEPLPEEGGLYRRTSEDAHGNAIYFLLADGDFSALHVLSSAEVYHFYDGAPLRMLLLYPNGRVAEPVLGRDLAAGQRPQLAVPPGVWQGSSSSGDWTLLGTTVTPPFEWDGFGLGTRAELSAGYPSAARRIAELTRT